MSPQTQVYCSQESNNITLEGSPYSLSQHMPFCDMLIQCLFIGVP